MIKANGIQYPMHRFIKNPQDILQTIIKNRICPFVVVPMMIPIIKKTLPAIAGILKDTKSFIFLPDVCMNLPAREYKHIQQYETEILRLKSEGYTHGEIGQKLGFTKIQVKNFGRYNIKQKKIATGMPLKKRGRPPKNYSILETDKVAELKYILARKEAKIKQLEMENELMRDFLSHAERK